MGRLLLFAIGLLVVLGFVIKTFGFLLKLAVVLGVIYLVVKAVEKKKLDR